MYFARMNRIDKENSKAVKRKMKIDFHYFKRLLLSRLQISKHMKREYKPMKSFIEIV